MLCPNLSGVQKRTDPTLIRPQMFIWSLLLSSNSAPHKNVYKLSDEFLRRHSRTCWRFEYFQVYRIGVKHAPKCLSHCLRAEFPHLALFHLLLQVPGEYLAKLTGILRHRPANLRKMSRLAQHQAHNVLPLENDLHKKVADAKPAFDIEQIFDPLSL